jgi:FdhE protein
MSATFDKRIARASELAESRPAAHDFLKFYVKLAQFQKPVFEELNLKEGTCVRDLIRYFPAFLEFVRSSGLDPLIDFANRNLGSVEAQEELLLKYWEGGGAGALKESGEAAFFARVLLQPFAESLANRCRMDFQPDKPTCPFCNAKPVTAVLRGEGDGAKRWLLCSVCSTEWPFRRVVCPNCGQQDKDKLPIYTAAGLDYVRVEACDVCRAYIKSVDLTKDGLAIPVVDELATVALNIWADEHGYTKLECNLLGF